MGAGTRMTLQLLHSACAVSLLLRFLGAPAAAADTCDALMGNLKGSYK